MKITKKLKALILERIESGDQIIDIADAIGVTRQAIYKLKKTDEDFADRWAEAKEIGNQVQLSMYEKEMDFRGRIGWLEPVHYEGRICGYKQKFSDGLLMARVKKLDPEGYGDKTKHEHSGQIDTGLIVVGKPVSDDDEWHAKHSGS